MRQIVGPAKGAGALVGRRMSTPRGALRLSTHVLVECVEEGTLLYHTLTGEMVLLEGAECGGLESPDVDNIDPAVREELLAKRFLVPLQTDDARYADEVLSVVRLMARPSRGITGFTIFTTTECNARCFYCYEQGRRLVSMTDEVAHAAASYIERSCAAERVSLHWFGGEPLCNVRVIELVTSDLAHAGIDFRSRMTSNSLLFDEGLVRKAVRDWHLRSVQVTIDGTREVYERTKAYVGTDDIASPFERVLRNVGLLLDAGVRVEVRLNLHPRNVDDLCNLAIELAERFGGVEGFNVYAAMLRNDDGPMGFADQKEAVAAYARLRAELRNRGLRHKRGLGNFTPLNQCMADSDSCNTIMPDGRLGLCQHYSESHAIGDVWEGIRDTDAVSAWKERIASAEECADCAFYPRCRMLKNCPYMKRGCSLLDRSILAFDLRDAMLTSYERYCAEADAD